MILWNSVRTSKEIRTYLTIVNIKNGGHVISRSGKRLKHVVFVSNAHPSCKIKILDKILCIMHKKLPNSIILNHFLF